LAHGVPNLRNHDGYGTGCSLRGQRRWSSCDHDQVNLKTNQVRRKLRQTLILLLGKPVLDGDIFSLDPAKLSHLLPERVHEDRATGSSAIIQETYAEDLSCLLRVCPRPTHRERDDDCKRPHPFWILDF
jgi:hypothetical protein